MPATTEFETPLWTAGVRLIAGVDEVGRGAWAGPVVTAAVILDPERIPAGLDDSKKLSAVRRAALAVRIHETALAVAFGEESAEVIDRVNILEATRRAMRAAIAALDPTPEHLLIDAVRLDDLGLPSRSIIKGDSRSVSIAAASIVAKVRRDAMMEALNATYPAYGFARHKGYGTAAHQAALAAHGPTPIHRLTFRGIRPEPPVPRTLSLPFLTQDEGGASF